MYYVLIIYKDVLEIILNQIKHNNIVKGVISFVLISPSPALSGILSLKGEAPFCKILNEKTTEGFC